MTENCRSLPDRPERKTLWAHTSGAEAVNGIPRRRWRFEGGSYYADVTEDYAPAAEVARLRDALERIEAMLVHDKRAVARAAAQEAREALNGGETNAD